MINLPNHQIDGIRRLMQRGMAAQQAVDDVLGSSRTHAQRKQAQREAKRAQGLRIKEYAVHPLAQPDVERYIARKNAAALEQAAHREIMAAARGKR